MTTRSSIEQSLAALVACDQSYFQYGTLAKGATLGALPDGAVNPAGDYANPSVYQTTPKFSVPAGYVVAATIERPEIGAKAIIYRNAATNDTIVAIGGSDGLNAQDYVSNTQSFGWSQWEKLKAPQASGSDKGLLNELAILGANTGTIQFTGQSLGGALAQYGAADYIQYQKNINAAYVPSNLTLTTFNSLGAKTELAEKGISEDIFNGLGHVAHYVVNNDLVSRLGGGHVGSNGETINLDWTYLAGSSMGKPMDILDAHRIETAFYTHIGATGSELATGMSVKEGSGNQTLINTPNAVAWAHLIGNLGNDGQVSALEAPFRLVAGFVGAGLVAGSEVDSVLQAFFQVELRAGKIGNYTYAVLSSANWIGFSHALATPQSSVALMEILLGANAADKIKMLIGDYSGRILPSERQVLATLMCLGAHMNVGVKAIEDFVSGLFNSSARFVQLIRSDPLTLDLDNDGLETVGTAAGILFDQTGSGVKTGTGWVKSDDGMLVLDRNGNGMIDSGRELFGDSTIKSNGQLAVDGFDALRDLDSNLDGKISNADAKFGSLRVWRDLNQDGISQSGELFSLTSLNITSINVASTDHSQLLANGNQVADLGVFTRADGSTGTT